MCSKFFLNVNRIFLAGSEKLPPNHGFGSHPWYRRTMHLKYKHFVDCSSTYSQAISGPVNKFINLPPTGFSFWLESVQMTLLAEYLLLLQIQYEEKNFCKTACFSNSGSEILIASKSNCSGV